MKNSRNIIIDSEKRYTAASGRLVMAARAVEDCTDRPTGSATINPHISADPYSLPSRRDPWPEAQLSAANAYRRQCGPATMNPGGAVTPPGRTVMRIDLFGLA